MNKKRLNPEQREEIETRIKEQIETHNKLLKNAFVFLGLLALAVLAVYLFMNSAKTFEYEGVEFTIEKYCDAKPCLTLYKVSIPIVYEDSTGNSVNADYNIYLRNDPRDLEVPVEGEIVFRPNMIMDVSTENLFCDGDWSIAIANLQKLDIFGVNLIARNNSEIAIYTPAENYMYVNINEANETEIVQVTENTYEINVANCDILEATEKLMIEAFVQAYN